MSENNKIATGDVVCLKSEKDKNSPQKFTVGSIWTNDEYIVYWNSGGELKTAYVHQNALHKLK